MIENRRKNCVSKIIIAVSLMLFIIIAPICVLAKEERNKLGDINADGKIDTTDLVLLLRHISAKKTNKNEKWVLQEEQIKIADITGDNKINSSDVLAILRYIAAKKSDKIAKKHKEWLEIREEDNEEIIAPEKIELNQKEMTMEKNETIKLIAKITPETANINQEITWSSSNEKVVMVDNQGTMTAKGEGTANITVKTANGKTASCTVTVKEPIIEVTEIKLNKTSLNIEKGNGERLTATVEPANATNKTIIWNSSNKNVATVSNEGFVTAIEEGTTSITVKTDNGKTASCTVTVKEPMIEVTGIRLNKTSVNIEKGNGERLIATVEPANATNKTITWSSSNNNVATVSNEGFVTATGAGTASITVKTGNGKTASCTITVREPIINVSNITMNKKTITLEKNQKEKLVATVEPFEATNKEIIWKSSNTKIATVIDGVVTANETGTATITAMSKSNPQITATVKVTVKTEYTQTRENLLKALKQYSKIVQQDYAKGKRWTYKWVGKDKSFESARNSGRRQGTCVSSVNWALKEIGALKPNMRVNKGKGDGLDNVNGGVEYLSQFATIKRFSTPKTPKQLQGTENELKAGDIIEWDYYHTSVYAGNKKFYDSGRKNGKNGYYSNGTYIFKHWGPIATDWTSKIRYIIYSEEIYVFAKQEKGKIVSGVKVEEKAKQETSSKQINSFSQLALVIFIITTIILRNVTRQTQTFITFNIIAILVEYIMICVHILILESRYMNRRTKSKHCAEHKIINFLHQYQRLPKNEEELLKMTRFSSKCGERFMIGGLTFLTFGILLFMVLRSTFMIKFMQKQNKYITIGIGLLIIYEISKYLTIAWNYILQLITTTKVPESTDISIAYEAARRWIKIRYPEHYYLKEDIFLREKQ